MAQTAKEYAQSQLGQLDLSHLDTERNVANDKYNTSMSSLENNFNNLLTQINNNRADTKQNFNTGRSTVAEQSYANNQANKADLASRGVGSSGLKNLGEVGNRIETGRQYSNLANEYYGDMSELDTTQKQGETQYGLDQQMLKNTLDESLAGIDSRGADATNNYNMTLGQLAESVQGRWDANENAKAAMAQQEKLAAAARAQAASAAQSQLKSINQQDLASIVNSGGSVDQMRAQLQSRFGIDAAYADGLLQELGLAPNKSFNFSVNEDYQPGQTTTDYLNQLMGGW